MSVIRVPTTFNLDLEFEVPEFYRRVISLLIDMLVQYAYIRIAIEIYQLIGRNYVGSGNNDSAYNMQAIAIILAVPVFIYHALMEITLNGQSIGKKIMGIRVVNENGGKPSVSQYLIRWILRISDLWILFVLVYFVYWIVGGGRDAESTFILTATLAFLVTDIVLVVSGKKNQRIGDLLAGTILIRTQLKASIEETVFQEVAHTYVPSYPQIMQLSDRDINAIKSILESSRRKGDFQMAASAGEKIRHHLGISTTLEPYEFLDTLLKDYNYLSIQ